MLQLDANVLVTEYFYNVVLLLLSEDLSTSSSTTGSVSAD